MGKYNHLLNDKLLQLNPPYRGSCIAAIFLKQFVAGLESQDDSDEDQTQIAYAHIDIAGVMSMSTGAQAYDLRGMSGKPVRALTEYVRRRAYNL